MIIIFCDKNLLYQYNITELIYSDLKSENVVCYKCGYINERIYDLNEKNIWKKYNLNLQYIYL